VTGSEVAGGGTPRAHTPRDHSPGGETGGGGATPADDAADAEATARSTPSDPANDQGTARTTPVGDQATVRVTLDPVDLFLFSAACGLTHRIHYDRDYARAEGFAGLPVQGPFQGALIAQAFSDLAQRTGRRLAGLTVRHVAPAYDGRELRLRTGPSTTTAASPTGPGSASRAASGSASQAASGGASQAASGGASQAASGGASQATPGAGVADVPRQATLGRAAPDVPGDPGQEAAGQAGAGGFGGTAVAEVIDFRLETELGTAVTVGTATLVPANPPA
jgi:acyl dehydratase